MNQFVFFSDWLVRKSSGLIEEVDIVETFSHFSNLDRNLGEQISTQLKLNLEPPGCQDGNSILESLNLVKVDLDKSSEEEIKLKNDKIPTLDIILKEKNILKRMSQMKYALMGLSENDLGKILKKYKNSDKFHYILESCGAVGTWSVYKQVLKALPPSTTQSGYLGKHQKGRQGKHQKGKQGKHLKRRQGKQLKGRQGKHQKGRQGKHQK